MNTLDLFGEVPVTLRDLELWLFKIPRLPHFHRSRASYARTWNIVDKIRRAKLDGTFDDAIHGEDCEFCGQLLAAVSPAPSFHPQAELDRLKRRVAVLEMVLHAATLPAFRSRQGDGKAQVSGAF